MLPERLAHFEITAKLGAGGMGDVYRATDTRLKREVALKILPPEFARSRDRLDRFKREAEALASLDHPNIVTIHSIEEARGLHFLTMQLVEGKTLSRHIPKGGLSIEKIFEIGIPLADALAVAHEKGIVHRDLKPSNVMITSRGEVKVLDFGLAKFLREVEPGTEVSEASTEYLTGEGARLGTLPYMSPEQIRGAPIDHRTDIFSLGIMLHEMAVGEHPFGADTQADLVSAILRDAPSTVDELRQRLPHHLGRIVRHCMEKKPEKRLQSARDLRNALEDLRREVSSADASAPSVRGEKQRSRTLVGLLATSLAIIATLSALVVFLARSGTQAEVPAERRPTVGVDTVSRFAENTTPDYVRGGFEWLLERRLRGLSDLGVNSDETPRPDFVVEVDTRRAEDALYVSYQVSESETGETLLGEVVRGEAHDEIALADQIADELAEEVGPRVGRNLRYRAPATPTEDPEALESFFRGLHLYRSGEEGEFEQAEEAFVASFAEDPGFALAKAYEGLSLARRFSESGEPSLITAAEAACEQAEALDADLDLAHFCLGEVLRLTEREVDAATEYQAAIELGQRDTEVFQRARDAFSSMGRPESEETFWLEIIGHDPSFWAGHAMLGRFYADQGRHESSLERYSRAIELAPTHIDLYLGLFSVQYLLGRFGEGIETLEDAIEFAPDDHRLWGNLGALYFLLRRFDESIVAFEKTVELRGDDYRAIGYLGRAYWWAPGRREEATPHLERAVELCEKSLERRPDNAEATILLAWYQAMLGRVEESRNTLDRTLELRPNDAHFFYLAGLIETVLADKRAALGYLERAVAEGWETTELRTTVEVDTLREEPRFQALIRGS